MLFHSQQLSAGFSLNLVAIAPKSAFGLKLPILAGVVGCMLVVMSFTHLCQMDQSWGAATSCHLAIQIYPLAFLAVSTVGDYLE